MSNLLDAYFTLGVEPSAALSDVNERYKWLASVYHPDRFSDSKKAKAELEMKRVNDARDTIKEHFASKHPTEGVKCDCFTLNFQPSDTNNAQTHSSQPQSTDSKTRQNTGARSNPGSTATNSQRAGKAADFSYTQQQTTKKPADTPAQTATKDSNEKIVWLVILAIFLVCMAVRGSAW